MFSKCWKRAGVDWDPEKEVLEEDLKDPDGMEGLVAVQKRQRFGPDLRLMEVCTGCSCKP